MKLVSLWFVVPAIFFLLVACFGDIGYTRDDSFYSLLRIGVTGLSAYMAVYSYQKGITHLVWILGGIAVVFNPVLKVHMDRDAWQVIDFISAGGIGYGWWIFKNHNLNFISKLKSKLFIFFGIIKSLFNSFLEKAKILLGILLFVSPIIFVGWSYFKIEMDKKKNFYVTGREYIIEGYVSDRSKERELPPDFKKKKYHYIVIKPSPSFYVKYTDDAIFYENKGKLVKVKEMQLCDIPNEYEIKEGYKIKIKGIISECYTHYHFTEFLFHTKNVVNIDKNPE